MYKWSPHGPKWPMVIGTASLFVLAAVLGEPRAAVTAAGVAGPAGNFRPVISSRQFPIDEKERTVRPTPEPTAPPTAQQEAVALANHDRVTAGLPPLAESPVLDEIAMLRAQQMVTDGLTHVRPGSRVMAATELLRLRGVTFTWHGENIFWAGGPPFDDAVASAHEWWMASPVHRNNILDPRFRQIGIGIAVDGDKMYLAAVFTD